MAARTARVPVVGIEISVEVKPDKREEFLQAIESLKPVGVEGADCVSYEVLEDREQNNRFFWVERWPDHDRLQARLRSDRFRALLGAVRVLGTVEDIQTVVATPWAAPV